MICHFSHSDTLSSRSFKLVSFSTPGWVFPALQQTFFITCFFFFVVPLMFTMPAFSRFDPFTQDLDCFDLKDGAASRLALSTTYLLLNASFPKCSRICIQSSLHV